MSHHDDLRRAMRNLRVVRSGGAQGPVRARVLKQTLTPEESTVEVQVLDASDQPDADWPTLAGVEVSALFAGVDGTGGIFGTLPPETIVRVGFYEFDPNRPYIDAVLPRLGAQVGGADLYVKATKAVVDAQAIALGSDQAIQFAVLGQKLLAWLNAITVNCPPAGGTSSTPIVPATADLLSTKVTLE